MRGSGPALSGGQPGRLCRGRCSKALINLWPNVASAVVALVPSMPLRGPVRRSRGFEVLEVGPDDAHLHHLLRVPREDTSRFQPGFPWDDCAT
jgi:hypothetical protein